jgi:hypothetical protein
VTQCSILRPRFALLRRGPREIAGSYFSSPSRTTRHRAHHRLSPLTTVTFTFQLVPPEAGRALRAARRALFAPMVAAAVGLSACGTDSTAPSTPSNPALETFSSTPGVNIATMTRRSDDLYIQDLVVGTGADATAGRTIRVTYSGWLVNGSRFDSNVGGQRSASGSASVRSSPGGIMVPSA